MTDDTLIHLISASVSPAVMISGTAMLVLSFLGRQGLLTGRLRDLHEKALNYAGAFKRDGNPCNAERAALSMQQAKAVYGSARNVKWTLIFLFLAIISFVLTSISLGVGVFYKDIIFAAAMFFVVGVFNLFVATLFAMNGALKSLAPLRREQAETEKLLAKINGIEKLEG